MRWDDIDPTTKSALALSCALIGLGVLAAWLSFQLQERWPMLVFLLAFLGVAIFLGGVTAWQQIREPKETNLQCFKQRAIFGLQQTVRGGHRSRWTTARDICLIALVVVLVAFVAHSLFIGGDAIRGYVSQGQYFVRVHVTVTEVSAAQWRLNWWLGVAVFTLLPLAIVTTTIAVYRERHDRFRYDDMDR